MGQSSNCKLYSILKVTVMVCDHIKAFSVIKEVCCSLPNTFKTVLTTNVSEIVSDRVLTISPKQW